MRSHHIRLGPTVLLMMEHMFNIQAMVHRYHQYQAIWNSPGLLTAIGSGKGCTVFGFSFLNISTMLSTLLYTCDLPYILSIYTFY